MRDIEHSTTHLSELRSLDAALDDPGELLVVVDVELRRGDGRADFLDGVDDFSDAWHAERDVHGRNASEVERLERHLRAGLPDTLRANCADRGAWEKSVALFNTQCRNLQVPVSHASSDRRNTGQHEERTSPRVTSSYFTERIIDYGCMFYSNTKINNLEKLEKLYYHSAIICTNAYKNTSRTKLLQELNWETFEQRSYYLGITMFAKIKFTKVPEIIYDEFPFSTTLRHSDRYRNNLQQLLSRRNYYYNSYFIKMFREWNHLPQNIKNTENYEDFKESLLKTQIKNYDNYNYETYWDTIYLSFRMKNSLLQAEKYKMGMTETNLCINCPTKEQETLYHYIFKCPKYNYCRNVFMQQVTTIAKLKNITNKNLLNLLLNNNNNQYLHKMEYRYLIQKFKRYLQKTKRFI